MYLILHWLIYALAILITAYLLPGVKLSGFGAAIIVAMILALFNTFVRPLLILFTLPLTIVTLGFFILIINSLLIQFTSLLVPGFKVDSFWWALLFGIILSIVHFLLSSLALGK